MKKIKLTGLYFIAITLGLTSCGKDTKTTTVAEKPKVKITTVSEREVQQAQTFTATVEPEIKNNIAPSVPGRIRQIFVEIGTNVSKGQRLAQMDAANLSNSETQIENLRLTYKRVSELFAVGGASQQELDNAKLQLNVAETNMKNLNENTYLLSPISGVVTARNYDAGDMYTGQTPILTIMKINPVQLRINVSESYYTKVKVGMPVIVKVEVFGEESFTGKVSLIYPTIDERSRTFPIEIKLTNNNGKIRPGMFARVNINFGTIKHVVVPDRAVIKQSGSAARFIYVYKNGNVSYKQVEVGQRIENEYELISGIENGEQVVVSGQSKLQDGIEVDVLK
jgi:RND family efflux transporter MFP subunit